MEDSYSTEDISRRQFLKFSAIFTAATATGIAAGNLVGETEIPVENIALLGRFYNMEHSNNAHWEYYQHVVDEMYEQLMQEELPNSIAAVGLDVNRSDGSSVHAIRQGNRIHLDERSFNNTSGQWETSESTPESFVEALKESMYLSVAYRTNDIYIDRADPSIEDLSQEIGCDLGTIVQNIHHINLKRDYNQNLGNKLIDRRVIDEYAFVRGQQKVAITTLFETTPNGFRSHANIPAPAALLVNEVPVQVSEALLNKTIDTLNQIVSS